MKIAFTITRTRNNAVASFGTLKVQSLMLTEVRDCDLLIVVTFSTFLKRKDTLRWDWVFFKSRLQNDVRRLGCGLAGLLSQQILLNLIKRCSNQHAEIFMNETNMRRFESVFTNRITSSWHQKSKISKWIVLIDNTLLRWITQVHRGKTCQLGHYTQESLVVFPLISEPGPTQIDSPEDHSMICMFPHTHFLGNANIMVWPKNQEES